MASKKTFEPKDMLNDILESSKTLCKLYSTFLTEASNDDTVYTLEDLESEAVSMQRDVFNLLYSKGWYKVEKDTSLLFFKSLLMGLANTLGIFLFI